MSMEKYKPKQNVALLRQLELEVANRKTTPQAYKESEIPPPCQRAGATVATKSC
jgi:hypothetical protein